MIPGSHRASFALPADVKEMEACEDWLREVPVKAGDCVRRRRFLDLRVSIHFSIRVGV